MVAVTGFSDRDYATVVYRDDSAGARGMLTEVLTGLTTVRASVTDRNTGQQLDRAIAHLADALDARLWDDENHLNPETGESVFRESQKTIEILCRLLNTTSANLPDATLNSFIERVVKASRLLALIAVEDAIEAGIPKSRLQQAQRFLARGDASSQINPCGKGLEDYGNAWKTLNRANIPAASGGN
jgi:hypothetical protein